MDSVYRYVWFDTYSYLICWSDCGLIFSLMVRPLRPRGELALSARQFGLLCLLLYRARWTVIGLGAARRVVIIFVVGFGDCREVYLGHGCYLDHCNVNSCRCFGTRASLEEFENACWLALGRSTLVCLVAGGPMYRGASLACCWLSGLLLSRCLLTYSACSTSSLGWPTLQNQNQNDSPRKMKQNRCCRSVHQLSWSLLRVSSLWSKEEIDPRS